MGRIWAWERDDPNSGVESGKLVGLQFMWAGYTQMTTLAWEYGIMKTRDTRGYTRMGYHNDSSGMRLRGGDMSRKHSSSGQPGEQGWGIAEKWEWESKPTTLARDMGHDGVRKTHTK